MHVIQPTPAFQVEGMWVTTVPHGTYTVSSLGLSDTAGCHWAQQIELANLESSGWELVV